MKKLDITYAKNVLNQVVEALGGDSIDWGNPVDIISRPMPSPLGVRFPDQYAAYNLLRKWAALETGIDREAAAWAAFWRTEERNAFINGLGGYQSKLRDDRMAIAAGAISYAQRKIATVLGAFSPNEFLVSCDHSGGASTQRTRRESSYKNKWCDIHEVTCEAAPLLAAVLSQQVIVPSIPRRVLGASGFTVPKDAKTDRLCFKEPQGNMFLQKGLGRMIRQRLRRQGINLNDQTANQRGAGDLRNATVDLSNASNLISRQTVAMLLQHVPDWLEVLEATRTAWCHTPKGWHELEMFSGMGNGFTFELESLIFYALACGAREMEEEFGGFEKGTPVLVYGDDIIVRAEVYDTLVITLGYCGFSVNRLKSYATGPFRESCGKHFYNERDITPIYIKTSTFKEEAIEDWYHLVNSLTDLNDRLNNDRVAQLINHISGRLKRNGLYNPVPASYGLTAGVILPFDRAHPTLYRNVRRKACFHNNFGGFAAKVYVEQSADYVVSELGSYAVALQQSTSVQFTFTILGRRLIGHIPEIPEPPSMRGSRHAELRKGVMRHRWVQIPFGDWL